MIIMMMIIIILNICLNKLISPINGILTDTITPGQSRPESDVSEAVPGLKDRY